MAEDEKKGTISYRLYCSIKCFQKPSSPEQKHGNLAETEQKKPGGWRAMSFVVTQFLTRVLINFQEKFKNNEKH